VLRLKVSILRDSLQFGACGPSITARYLFPSIITVYVGAVFFKEETSNPMGTVITAILISLMENGFLLIDAPLAGREVLRGIYCSLRLLIWFLQ